MKKIAVAASYAFILIAVTELACAHNPYSPLAGYVEANYTKPSNNGLSVGDLLFADAGGNIFDGGHRAVFIHPDAEYDYSIGFTYHLRGTRTRLFLDYDHFDLGENDYQIDIRNFCYLPPPDTYEFNRLDIISHELRAGAVHNIAFDRLVLDFSAFFENIKLTQTLFERIIQQEDGANEIISGALESKSRGFGPGIGIKARTNPYWLCPQWSLFAGMRASLLHTQHQYRTSYVDDAPAKGGFYIYEADASKAVIGKLDIQFGLHYHFAFKHEMKRTKWDMDLGMRYMNMFNVLKNGATAFNPNAGANNDVINDFAPRLGAAFDWGRYGPFLRFSVGGAES